MEAPRGPRLQAGRRCTAGDTRDVARYAAAAAAADWPAPPIRPPPNRQPGVGRRRAAAPPHWSAARGLTLLPPAGPAASGCLPADRGHPPPAAPPLRACAPLSLCSCHPTPFTPSPPRSAATQRRPYHAPSPPLPLRHRRPPPPPSHPARPPAHPPAPPPTCSLPPPPPSQPPPFPPRPITVLPTYSLFHPQPPPFAACQ